MPDPRRQLPDILTSHAGRRLRTPVFHPEQDLDPVKLSSYAAPSREQTAALLRRYDRAGFVLIEAAEEPTSAGLLALAGHLRLGEVFVPPLYRTGAVQPDPDGVSRLAAAAGGPGRDSDHPAVAANAQPIHVDGLLQPIGQVKTSILLCRTPAARGGQSILFNSTAAVRHLAATDPDAAALLMAPGVLVRTASVNGCTDAAAGAAFTAADGALLSRYSCCPTDRWDSGAVTDPAALHRGVQFLAGLQTPGSGLFIEFSLRAGQGLLLANDRIGHGRRGYTDSGPVRREMLRALFLHRPAPR
jgi:hypothetical protein